MDINHVARFFGGGYLPSLVIITLCLFSQACISVALLETDSGSLGCPDGKEKGIQMMAVATTYGSLSQIDFAIDLARIDSAEIEDMTSTERLRRATLRSRNRLDMFLSTTTIAVQDIDSPVHAGNGEFLMQLAIGTPPLTYNGIVDTGSDLIWTQCKPCTNCYKQEGEIYDPSKSTTFKKVPCSSPLCDALPYFVCSPDCQYQYQYGDQSFTTGVLALETFTLETTSHGNLAIPRVAFGCGNDNEGGGFGQASGLVGMGRGPLSLISQLGSKVSHKFSYCLVSINDPASKTSPLLFGNAADLRSEGVKSTTLVQNPARPSFYYLKLEGVSAGGSRLDLATGIFDVRKDGTGGIIIDSGTTITYLEESVYGLVKKAVQASMTLEQADGSGVGLDVCYKMPSGMSGVKFPAITFHFAGGADYDLPEENSFIKDDDSGLVCLAMAGSSGLSIFGNIQQQNFHILYDLGMNMLSFVPTTCDSL